MSETLKPRVDSRSSRYYGGMADQLEQLSIGQVSTRTGLSVHTLRFYEREGILAQPVRRAVGACTPKTTSTGSRYAPSSGTPACHCLTSAVTPNWSGQAMATRLSDWTCCADTSSASTRTDNSWIDAST